ncbi:MAG: hypothetical protein KGZ94_01445 [Clostridia bacterium]|nr:hypothetical protein [Clostridia bacterium]
MKKLFVITALALGLLIYSGPILATNMVSNMATEKGGLAVAECAKRMGGLQQCATQNINGSCMK